MSRHVLPLLLLVLLLVGCKEDDTLIVVPENQPPADTALSEQTIRTYINKVYIASVGRKPEAAEESTALAQLTGAGMSRQARADFVDALLQTEAHRLQVFEEARARLLNSVNEEDIRDLIAGLQQILNNTQYEDFWYLAEQEIDRLEAYQDADSLFILGLIDLPELHKRCVNNAHYDDINMGTQNFVLSMFENFLGRYPTVSEEAAAIAMVDGYQSSIFLQDGSSKTEFIDIFVGSKDYAAGLIGTLFERHLFRAPTAAELADFSIQFRNTNDFFLIEREVLIMDEYVRR